MCSQMSAQHVRRQVRQRGRRTSVPGMNCNIEPYIDGSPVGIVFSRDGVEKSNSSRMAVRDSYPCRDESVLRGGCEGTESTRDVRYGSRSPERACEYPYKVVYAHVAVLCEEKVGLAVMRPPQFWPGKRRPLSLFSTSSTGVFPLCETSSSIREAVLMRLNPSRLAN